MFTAYLEKVLTCAHNVLVKSEYIEYENDYEHMTISYMSMNKSTSKMYSST